MNKEQPELPDQLVVQVVVTDLQGCEAYAFTGEAGKPVIFADRTVLANDRTARESAFRAFVTQAAPVAG